MNDFDVAPQSDWEALRRFKSLASDQERMEQMFMASLEAARLTRETHRTVTALDVKVGIQNGRTGKLETRWIQLAAVVAFLLAAIPILLGAVSLLK